MGGAPFMFGSPFNLGFGSIGKHAPSIVKQ
jgi:hypothetical protein